MSAVEEIQAAIDNLTELEADSTRGPWERGDRWAVGGVLDEMFGAGKCHACKRLGEPSWIGKRDINGTRMTAHVHEGPTWYEHGINAVRDSGPVSVVNDTDEYGYMTDADADLIVTLHRTIDAQLTILNDFMERYSARQDTDWEPIAPSARNALNLARAINGGTR